MTQQIRLGIEGMSCAGCVGRVERALLNVTGVSAADVNLATEQASIETAQSIVPQQLIDAVASAGYQAHLVENINAESDRRQTRKSHELEQLQRNWLFALLLTIPVFILEMGGHLIPPLHHLIEHSIGLRTSWYIQFALTILLLIGPGRQFFRLGIPALLRGAPDMNSLVAIGTGAAYGFSVVATFIPQWLPEHAINVYFEAAAVIVTLILLGRLLEARAKGKTSLAIQRLIGLQPKTATVERNGQPQTADIADIQLGDVLLVRPGERIAIDGEVIDGDSFVDESMISGEPVPLQKTSGSHVTGGTVNQTGSFRFKASAVGESTVLAQIIRLVEQAQGARLPIQDLVNRITMWFVPAVLVIAALTFIVWWLVGPAPAVTLALVNAVAVLIVACPCAMGLATPTSIMVGTGRGAELGLLFRQGDALQRLKDVQLVAFDKTGTLTAGKPTLNRCQTVNGFDSDTLLALTAVAESRSEHPIAQAIVNAVAPQTRQAHTLESFTSVTGGGIQAVVDGQHLDIGAHHLMETLGIDISALNNDARNLREDGNTVLFVAVDKTLAALIAVADPLKPSSVDAINQLHKLGLQVAMISGDNPVTANAIARQLTIDTVIADVRPDGKVDALRKLREQYGDVAFVGDGINDAPALAEADVGIAIGTGTDVAIESADVVLMSDNLQGVVNAIALSKATMRNIRQNLFWAFAYNTALIPVAAGVLIPLAGIALSPVFAAAAMALSSVFVVTNALRLRRFSIT